MGFPASEGMAKATLFAPSAPDATSLSAVVDREDFVRGAGFAATIHTGSASAASLYSGLVLQLFESDTVSATASGMDAISGAGVSGVTASKQYMEITGDLRYRKRFIGAKLSVPTGFVLVDGTFTITDVVAEPPSASLDGLAAVTRI